MTPPETRCILHEDPGSTGEKRLLIVLFISLWVMVLEIIGGIHFGSMALLADGWHMGTHLLALGLTYVTSWVSRKMADDPRFGFGPARIRALGGFSGALLLGIISLEIMASGVGRFLSPQPIAFTESLWIASIGLLVNGVGAVLLHGSAHSDEKSGHRTDHHLRSAYLHVIADMLTSILAIIALSFGWIFHWMWPDAVVAVLGGAVILRWSIGLLWDSGRSLLDYIPHRTICDDIRSRIEGPCQNLIRDLHVWPIGNGVGVIATVTTGSPTENGKTIRDRLSQRNDVLHITIEIE
jgi:cation diffusion facilitator family transporter